MNFRKISKPIVFLPVESTPRELDYKLNLARLFCDQGFDAIIGNPPFLRDELKYKNYKGIFLEKGMNPNPSYYQGLVDKGIKIYCLGDEGAAIPTFSVTYTPAVESLKKAERIFLWGEFQKNDLIQRNNDFSLCEKYLVTGYPSFDLNLPPYKSLHAFLRPKSLSNGYILINTNFASFNGYSFDQTLESCTAMSPETRESIRISYEREEKTFQSFMSWLKKIIYEFPEENFIIRPHPVERSGELYLKILDCFKNVKISTDGTANQVISGAKLVLHNDCTTALQSYLLGVPVVSLANSSKAAQHSSWSMKFGSQPETAEIAIDHIKHIIKTGTMDEKLQRKIHLDSQELFSTWFCNIGNATKNIVDIMINETAEKFDNFQQYKITDDRSFIQRLKYFISKFLPIHYKVPVASRNNLKPFFKKDILLRLNYLNEIDGVSSRYKVKRLYPNAYFIGKEE